MHSFERKLITEWRRLKLPFRAENVVVAISGGADSLSLLLALAELQRRRKLDLGIIAAHVNHSLRGKTSDADEAFVEGIASKCEFVFVSRKIRLTAKGNVEENARRLRYDFLRKTARKFGARFVVTAHTINDQAETFLLNLIRGSGIEGLSGMKSIRALRFENAKEIKTGDPEAEVFLARPLLNWALRTDTENYCRDLKAEFRVDEMNFDPGFSRVRIRREILPALAKMNPKIVATLARTARLLSHENRNSEVYKNQPSEKETRIARLRILSANARIEAIREWLRAERGDLRQVSSKHIEAIDRLIMSEKSGREIQLPRDAAVLKRQGRIHYLKRKVEKSSREN